MGQLGHLGANCFRSHPGAHRWVQWRWRTVVRGVNEAGSPYAVLEISRGADKQEIREAYLAKIRLLHPDVNEEDTTKQAARVIAAYKELMDQTVGTSWSQGDLEVDVELDVFDSPDGPAQMLFVDPFGCFGVDPFMWRELQEVASQGDDPEDALLRAGVGGAGNAIHYVSKGQLEALVEELNRMEGNLDVETCSWYIESCLARARWANMRW